MGRANQWLLVLVLGEPNLSRLIVGHRGDVVANELTGASRSLDDLFDNEALADAPVLPGWWLWEGERAATAFGEDDVDFRWLGRWDEAVLEDLEAVGLKLPGPGGSAA